ncbi:MAG: nitrous oxide reductase family maturation protein NosD [Bacteriovoracaceae bacterium]|nr:nitrous oxide reductase family maturation protein NosD [Bacteriovoracaceae bacterium]
MKQLRFLIIFILSSWALLGACDDSMNSQAPSEGWHQEVKTGPLQKEINKLLPNQTLKLSPGLHHGPIHIKTPGVKIEGLPGTIITGDEIGSVIVIEANDVTIKGLTIKGSGLSYTQADSGIGLRSVSNIKLLENKIEDCLFGIDVYSGNNNLIQDNVISSKNLEIGLRGDAIRLWSVTNSKVLNNQWSHSRDVVSWYSQKIDFHGNRGSDSRYSIHSMYSKGLKIQNNTFKRNQVGIFLMYGSDFIISNNYIERAQGATGMGIGLKETSNIIAQNNTINYSAVGVLVDNSPFNSGSRNWFHGNKFSFNGKGVVLSNDLVGGEFKRNSFVGNLQDVDTEHRRGSQSVWDKNYWDKYVGFDEDKNDIGDTPFVIRIYGDSLRKSNPKSSLFYGTPLFTLMGIIEEVANLGEPIIVLIDKNPNILKK